MQIRVAHFEPERWLNYDGIITICFETPSLSTIFFTESSFWRAKSSKMRDFTVTRYLTIYCQ